MKTIRLNEPIRAPKLSQMKMGETFVMNNDNEVFILTNIIIGTKTSGPEGCFVSLRTGKLHFVSDFDNEMLVIRVEPADGEIKFVDA